ncbi:MAG: hypothetical protein ACTHMI_10970 [Mucilaginibacter sp.]
MTGGTFTINNGSVFGSMMPTPILNSSQSPSYDHRIIDGRESVGFLIRVK